MSSYAATRADAYRDLLNDGGAVTMTRVVQGAETATGGVDSGSTSTITGAAIGKRSDPVVLAGLALSPDRAQTLYFAASTDLLLSAYVQPGDTFPFGGFTFTVKAVQPLAVNGYVITANIVGGR